MKDTFGGHLKPPQKKLHLQKAFSMFAIYNPNSYIQTCRL